MSLFKLCEEDKLLKLLRETFRANPVKIPEERIKPLSTLGKWKNKDIFLGASITELLTDPTPFANKIQTTTVSDVSASKTANVNFSLGFEILKGFLKGMGVDGSSLKSNFTGVEKVSFSFQNVRRDWLDISSLGSFLKGKSFDRGNPATAPFFKHAVKCVVIDSTIVSNNFTMNIEESSNTGLEINIPAIKDSVGKINSGLKISSNNSLSISFKGPKSLAFAFSAINLEFTEEGLIEFVLDFTSFSSASEIPSDKMLIPVHAILYDDAGLISFDDLD